MPPPLHPRLTVVRADADAVALARQLAAALAGLGGVDLRPDATALIDAAAVQRRARDRAASVHGERVAARDRAAARRSELAARRTNLLERAQWCHDTAGAARALLEAVEQAEAAAEAARADLAAADARRRRVADQRALAQEAVQEAQLELEGLEGAALDETGVRRQLETASRAERDAIEARDAARARLDELQARLDQLRAEEEAVVAALGALADQAPSADDDAVADALRRALADHDDAVATAGPDLEAAALAESLRRVEAELLELSRTLPQPPTDGQLAGAEADVAAARRRLDAARAASGKFAGPPPAWWEELTALHAAVVDAEAALGGGLRKGAARRRYEEALAAERAVLDSLGFDSYLDALMSGGRLPGDRDEDGVRVATEALAQAEQVLAQLHRHLVEGAPLIHLLDEQHRLRAAAAEVLGCDPGPDAADLLDGHRFVPRAILGDLAAIAREAGIDTAGVGVADAARRWLAAHDAAHDPHRRAELEERRAALAADRAATEHAITPALDEADRSEAAADAASRTTAGLHAELRSRAGDDGRLLERATAARELRDQVAAVEARLAAAETEALEAYAVAAEAVAGAEAAHDRVAQDLAELTRRATRAAADLPADKRPPVDLLTGLVPLGGALRAEADAIVDELAEAEAAVLAAEAAAAAPDEPSVDDLVLGLRDAFAAAQAPVVLAEPFAGAPPDGLERLLDALVAATGDRPAVVVTGDLDVVGWAIGLPADVGALVADRSLDPFMTCPTGSPDAAVTARRTAD